MKTLVTLLEGLGLRNVRTYIQSGNVIFNAEKSNRGKLANAITHSIAKNLGFSPKVILLTEQELQSAIESNPFPTDIGKALHFLFLEDTPDKPDIAHLNEIKTSSEAFELTEKAFYLYTPDGFGKSKLPGNIEKCLGVATTGRNWNTICKLASMLSKDNDS
jgi:uncharacterized protein (DUF1697 family)